MLQINLSSMILLVATCVEVDRNAPHLPALEQIGMLFLVL